MKHAVTMSRLTPHFAYFIAHADEPHSMMP